jgi:beta-glucosidase
MKFLLALFLIARPAAASDPGVEARVDALLSRMTREEKLGQLQQFAADQKGVLELIRQGKVGSFVNAFGAAETNRLQRAAMEQSRLKIPILFGFDVIHGYRTVYPIPLGEAASWDPALAERDAAMAAAEAAAAGIKWTFAPMVDIARDPRWGRILEGAGEDPFLGAAFARARVRGFQGGDPAAPDRVAACAKHWAAYGAAEAGRDYNTTDVSERTLREIYFPPFKAAAEAGAMSFMSAFNDLNGVPSSANPWLIREVLRKEWKFGGFVVSDWTAVSELMNHGLAKDGAEAARLALEAGVDMEMVSTHYAESVPAMIKSGKLPAKALDDAVRRVLRAKVRLGLFERPFVDEAREKQTLLSPAHLALAREAAAGSFVLLKNDGTLPFKKEIQSLAVIGPLADDPAPLGAWVGEGRKEDVVTLLAGVREKLPQLKLTHAKGCDWKCESDAGFAEAVEAAKSADAVVLALGEDPVLCGEAASRAFIDLPGRQLDLAKAVIAANKRVAVVLMNGRPLAIPWLAENAPAVLETWFAGVQAGPAIADALFGDANPGGKLPVSFPRTLGQVPVYYNHRNTGRPPDPDNRYSSKYLDAPWTPLYPFGYGLSYTSFRLGGLSLSGSRIAPGGSLGVRVSVENTGPVSGDEVVQLYLRGRSAGATRPVRELKGFSRVTLKPGEKREVAFSLGPAELGALDGKMKFSVAPGEYKVFVGTDSTGGLEAAFEVAGEAPAR